MTFATSLVALACMNAVVLQTDEARKMISRAEKLLDDNQPKKALRVLENNNEEFTVTDNGNPQLEKRLQLLRAVAQIRTTYIKLGLSTLQPMLKQDPDNPVLKARVAEGLAHSKSPASHAEALKLLEDLERRDLMPDAYAWATLAELRDAAGDAPARDKALERCRQTSKKSDICPLPKTT